MDFQWPEQRNGEINRISPGNLVFTELTKDTEGNNTGKTPGKINKPTAEKQGCRQRSDRK